ncbi:MAG: multicopper oxidase domain-containing protein, partial [Methylococcaceae bacterium]
ATLTPRAGLRATLPELRPRTLLTLADMGMTHDGGHSHHNPEPAAETAEHSPEQLQHGAMPTMDHSLHNMENMENMENMDHSMPQQPATPVQQNQQDAHKILSYQDLQAANPTTDWSKPDREISLRLTGNMNRYIWSFDDIKYSDAEPIKVRFGERIRFNYVNETMMNHPIHLHGLWQYLDNGDGEYNPKKHVINVKPGQTVSVLVVADAVGEWAFHCHLMYHMDTGMFRKLIVEKTERH